MNKNVCVMCGDRAVTTANHIPVCNAHYEAYRKEAALYPDDRRFYHALVLAYNEALKQDAGRAALAAPEPPSPATDDDIVCEGCGQRKPDSTFTESGGLHLCADCTSDAGSAAYIEMLRGYAEAAEERAVAAERKLAAATEAHEAEIAGIGDRHRKERAAYRKLIEAARAFAEAFWPDGDDSDWQADMHGVFQTEVDVFRDALAALEGDDRE